MANYTSVINDTANPISEFLGIFSITMSSIGLAANTLLMYIFLVDSSFRKKIYYLMTICCLTDLIVNISTIILNSMFWTSNGLSITTINCKILGYIVDTSYSVSIMNLSLIAIYRYMSVIRPFSLIYLHYKKEFLIASEVFIWISSMTVNIPQLMFIDVVKNSKDFCDYSEINTSKSIYLISYVTIFYITPSAVIIVLYWKIILNQHNHVRPGQPSANDKRDIEKKYKVIKSLIFISESYILITWPWFAVLLGIGITGKSFSQIRQENHVHFWLCMFSLTTTSNIAVINPFLYFTFDGNIRSVFMNRIVKRLLNR